VNPFDKHSALGAFRQVPVCFCCKKTHNHSFGSINFDEEFLVVDVNDGAMVVNSVTKQKTNKNTNGCFVSIAAGPWVGLGDGLLAATASSSFSLSFEDAGVRL